MDRITVQVPQKEKQKWIVSFSKLSHRQWRSVVTLYGYLERRLKVSLASGERIKRLLKVRYGPKDDDVNQGVYETSKELLYALAAFLENYLSKEMAQVKYKLYGN